MSDSAMSADPGLQPPARRSMQLLHPLVTDPPRTRGPHLRQARAALPDTTQSSRVALDVYLRGANARREPRIAEDRQPG